MEKTTDLFSSWALLGKDEGMETGHAPSVAIMLEHAFERLNRDFTGIDIGCGNGWVVRTLESHPLCNRAIGVDGAKEMIVKARTIDPEGHYVHAHLPGWHPSEPVDLVFSMEFMYYLQQPESFLAEICTSWIKQDGWLIMGIDHYLENESSLTWADKLEVHMTTKSEEEWKMCLINAGFKNVKSMRVGQKEGWSGTLILIANRQ